MITAKILDKMIADARQALKDVIGDTEDEFYAIGRIEALAEVRDLIKD